MSPVARYFSSPGDNYHKPLHSSPAPRTRLHPPFYPPPEARLHEHPYSTSAAPRAVLRLFPPSTRTVHILRLHEHLQRSSISSAFTSPHPSATTSATASGSSANMPGHPPFSPAYPPPQARLHHCASTSPPLFPHLYDTLRPNHPNTALPLPPLPPGYAPPPPPSYALSASSTRTAPAPTTSKSTPPRACFYQLLLQLFGKF
ncbi:hypothetical protein DFP73DRAFT_599011 [Morchella snyderi]|nr:hypothetical protein DFP73DRAFT_599011 [Morchella snyderi]